MMKLLGAFFFKTRKDQQNIRVITGWPYAINQSLPSFETKNRLAVTDFFRFQLMTGRRKASHLFRFCSSSVSPSFFSFGTGRMIWSGHLSSSLLPHTSQKPKEDREDEWEGFGCPPPPSSGGRRTSQRENMKNIPWEIRSQSECGPCMYLVI